jgi:hypothetical protein
MEKLVESHPIIMEVTLYVGLGVNPGTLEITLDSGKLSTKLQSLILEQKWKEEMLFYIPGLRVWIHYGSIIGCDFKKIGVVQPTCRKAKGTMICAQCTEPFTTTLIVPTDARVAILISVMQ